MEYLRVRSDTVKLKGKPIGTICETVCLILVCSSVKFVRVFVPRHWFPAQALVPCPGIGSTMAKSSLGSWSSAESLIKGLDF